LSGGVNVKEEITLRVAKPEDIEFLFSLLKAALGPYVEQTYGAWARGGAARQVPRGHSP
jgi:hypothetical protein